MDKNNELTKLNELITLGNNAVKVCTLNSVKVELNKAMEDTIGLHYEGALTFDKLIELEDKINLVALNSLIERGNALLSEYDVNAIGSELGDLMRELVDCYRNNCLSSGDLLNLENRISHYKANCLSRDADNDDLVEDDMVKDDKGSLKGTEDDLAEDESSNSLISPFVLIALTKTLIDNGGRLGLDIGRLKSYMPILERNDTLPMIDYNYVVDNSKGLSANTSDNSQDVSNKAVTDNSLDGVLNRRFGQDVNTFLDFIGTDTYTYKDTMVNVCEEISTYVPWSIVLERDRYTFIYLGAKSSSRFDALTVSEVKGLYTRLVDVINVRLRFIGLEVKAK